MSDPTEDVDRGAIEAMAAGADGGLAVAVDGRLVAVTDEWCAHWGADRSTLVGSPVAETGLDAADGGPPDSGETVRIERPVDDATAVDSADSDDGNPTSIDVVVPTLEVTAEAVELADTEYLVYTSRDVTEQVRLERDSTVLDALFEHIPVYLSLKDKDARHVRVSENYWDTEAVLGKTDREVFGNDTAAESYADDLRVIEEGEVIVNKEEVDPERNHHYLVSKVPWRDENGDIRGLIGVSHDVTERERRRQQLEEQNERLRTVASVISHDVRNPLQVAQGRLALAREERDSENLVQSAEALERMNTLLADLLALVRHGQWIGETELVSMRSAAEAVWETAAPESATLGFDQEFFLYADEARLQELLENLFRNAVVHAGPDVHVQIGPFDDWAGFYVEDDGPGIPEDERDQVFDSGFTTAEEGTGFGLAIVDVIADAHGWDARLAESGSGGVPDEQRGSGTREASSPGARFEFVGVEFE